MRILRAGHAACAEAPRDSQGVAAAAVPAAMKRRRLIFTDIDSLPEFSGSVAHRPATATCEGRDRLAQLPTLAQAHQRHEWHWRPPYFRVLENIAATESGDTAFGGRRRP